MDIAREGSMAEHAELDKKYGVLFSTVAAALFEFDPMDINSKSNCDEYYPEVGTILPRLEQAHTVEEVEVIVHEEFGRWFGLEEVGPVEDYRPLAETIWVAWSAFIRRQA